MGKFIGYTVGLECNGWGQVGKMVKVEYSRLPSGEVSLQATNGRNLSRQRGMKTLPAEAFSDRPTDDDIAEALWALRLCGWAPMGEAEAKAVWWCERAPMGEAEAEAD